MQQYFQRMQNRSQLSPDARPLKRHNRRSDSFRQSGGSEKCSGGITVMHPDVFPQQEKQEEDNLGHDRLARGYQIEVIHSALVRHEYDSLMKNNRIFATDDQLYRAARWIKQIMNKKNELNVIWLDKNWIKENNVRGFIFDNSFREDFFESLVSGKRIQLKDSKRHSLAACFPRFCRGSYEHLNSMASAKIVPLCEAMSLLYEKGVPIQKAIWFLKMNQVAHPFFVTVSKQKKGGNTLPCDDYSSDQRQFFIRYLRCLLREFDKAIPGQLEQNIYYQRWPYYAALIKHSFEDGMLDRHEFVLEMCELLSEFSNFSMEQPQTFRILIILMTQFTDIVTQNVFIARRLAFILCSRLLQYRKDYEKMRNQNLSPISPETCFDDLTNCQHHRPTLLVIFGFLHAILLDCPSALVWTPFEPQELLEGSLKSSKISRAIEKENALQSITWLCGSPLDYLPCKIEVTCQHFSGSFKNKMLGLLNKKVDEIKMRSLAVEDRWAFINPSNSQFGIEAIIEECLNIISYFDTIPFDKPNALQILYENIFPKEEKNEFVGINIRVRMLVLWAVTAERSGTHRSLIVTKLLFMLSKSQNKFDSFKSIHDLLVDCLNRDWVFNEKSEEGNVERFRVEFGNLMLLFYELQRVGLFDHDRYVCALMRNGSLGNSPLYQKLKSSKSSGLERVEQQASSKRQSVDLTQARQENPMIISFIPTTPSVPSNNNNPFIGLTQNQQKSDEFAKLQQEYESDVHPHLNIKSKLSFHERFILHLPIAQLESNRDACNQRAIVLYGISDQRDQVRESLRTVARAICKLWKRLSVEIVQPSPDSPSRELRYKRKCTNEQINEQMDRFRAQTYFDQLVICGWCADNFVDSIVEFLRQLSEQQAVLPPFPTSECLDILCEMIFICKNPHSLLTLSAEILSFLVQIELEFSKSNQKIKIDTIPNSLTSQLAYVIVVRLVEHFYYFLHSPEAHLIYNSLYKLIQTEIELVRQKSPITCWSRTIAVFLLYTRNKLINIVEEEGNETITLLGKYEDLTQFFPSAGSGSLARNLKYDQQLMVDQLNQSSLHNSRFSSYNDLKIRLQGIQNEHSKYSFVVNAFRAANSYGRDYERLVELANFCAHVSTQLGLETEWCSAIQELCCSNISNNSNWNEMLFEINVNDFSTHYALATFVLLLASKYAFSPHALICRLISNVFYSIIREEGGFANDDLDNGFCLALYICSVLVCADDMPFICNDLGQRNETVTLRRDCNQLALKIAHLSELSFVLFPLLSVIMQLVDELKRKVEASRKDATNLRKFSKQLAIARCALLSICDQDWVIERMFVICSCDNDMDNFINCSRLKNHSVGQQLLRVALRRKSERNIKQELMECTDKTIYEKLFSALSIWNMRATYFDFKLIINETFPESQMSKLGNGNQQLANHYQMTMFLFNNIATAIHQLFLSRLNIKDRHHEEELNINDFRPSGINCFWQLASLVTAMPSPPPPTGMSSQNPHWCPWIGSAMKAYFLKVVAENLKTAPEKDAKNKQSENIEQLKYEQLLAYQPFLNLVMACTEGEDVKQLVDTLLDYLDDVVARVRKNPIIPHQSFFLAERDGVILRLNLIVGLFDNLTTNSNAEFWVSALFQLLYFEILTYERDTIYFDTCLDMLLMLVHKMYPHKLYSTFVSKFKNFRIPDELYSLQQLLPVLKSQAELTAWDSFSNSIPHNKLAGSNNTQSSTTTSKVSTSTTSQPSQQLAQSNLPMAKPQMQGIVIDKQQISVHKQILRMLKHEHWMQRQIRPNGEQTISFIPRPGIVGEERIGGANADPFLAPPEMEQVFILQDQIDRQDKQQQSYQQNILAAAQQQQQQQRIIPTQPSIPEQHYKMESEQQLQHMRAAAYSHQQHQIKMEQQQNVQMHPGMMQQPTQAQHHFLQQQKHQQQQILHHQQMMSMAGSIPPGALIGEPGPSRIQNPYPPQQPILNLLQQSSQGVRSSGSNTPNLTDSPRTGSGRGGRRKGGIGPSGAGRGQKKKREAKQQLANQLLGPHNMGMDMFSATSGAGPSQGITQGIGPSTQMNMNTHAAMMAQQQQMSQIHWQQQMQQRQQMQPPPQQGGQTQVSGSLPPPYMIYNNQQQQQSMQQPPPQFRMQSNNQPLPQQQPPPPPQYHSPASSQQQQSRTNQFNQQQQMSSLSGIVSSNSGTQQQQQQILQSQQQPMSDIKKHINQKLMQKKQNQQAAQQQHHTGMGGMGPPGH